MCLLLLLLSTGSSYGTVLKRKSHYDTGELLWPRCVGSMVAYDLEQRSSFGVFDS